MISQVFFSFFSHFIYKRNRQNVTPFESSGLLLSMESTKGQFRTQRAANDKLETHSTDLFGMNVLQTVTSDENTFEPSLVEYGNKSARSARSYVLRSSLPDFIQNTSGANRSSMTPRESTGRHTREQSIFTAYKKRNISRLVFLFSENGIITLYKIFLEIEEYLYNVSTLFELRRSFWAASTEYGIDFDRTSRTNFPSNSPSSSTRIQPPPTTRELSKNQGAPERGKAQTSNSYALFRKFASKIQKPLALLMCLIPYVLSLGFLLTLTSFKFSRDTVSRSNTSWESSHSSVFREAKTNKMSDTRQVESPSPSTHDLYSYEMQMSGSCANTGIHSGNFYIFAFEILRFANYASKIFFLWAFFNIWRGIRPGQSIRNEYTIQTRMLTRAQNRKSFQDVEGIEKFLPILRTLVLSLQKYSSFSLSSMWSSLSMKWGMQSLSESKRQPKLFPKGYLFIGPPGTGKTLLAQAVAGEAGVKLICLSASEIQKQIESGTRIGAIRLRNLFKQARKNTPCILFLDEIDSIGKVPTDGKYLQSESSSTSNAIRSTSPSQRIKNTKLALFSAIGGQAEGPTKAGVGPDPGAKPECMTFGQAPSHQASAQLQRSLHLNPTVREYTTVQFREANTTSDAVSGESYSEKFIQGGFASSQSETNQYERTSTSSGNRTCDITLLTEFLIQMDSFSSEDGFLVIGTTNFLPNLDTAFIRSGRFDRIIGLQFPGKQTRIGLLKLYGKKQGVDPSISWDFFGKKTKGLSAADLSKVMNESSLYLIEKYLRTRGEGIEYGEAPSSHGSIPQSAKAIDSAPSNSTKLDTSPISSKWIRQVFSKNQQKFFHTSESIEKGIEKISTREKFVS